MLKMALLNCTINKNIAVFMEDGAFAFFFSSSPTECDN